jgi:hypothetical protein
MDKTVRPSGHHTESDPYFQATDVGPLKGPTDPRSTRGRRPDRGRMAVLVVALAIVWLGILFDPRIGPLVLVALTAFGAVVGLFGAMMGLGLLGFGLCAAGDRLVGWLRRGARWPEK